MRTVEQWGQVMRASGASPATIRTRTGVLITLRNRAQVVNSLDIDREHVVAMLADCRSQWTRLTYYQSIRRWQEFLADFDITNVDLLKGIPKPRTPAPAARPITDDQVRRLLGMPMQPRTSAFVRLALFQALRVHEIAKVRGEDVSGEWLTVTGKGNYTAVVPLHAEIAALVEWMPAQGWWFPSRKADAPVTPQLVASTIKAALAEAGITATAHQLRDTAATRIQRQTRNMRVTQRMLRHRTITATAKYVAVADMELLGASARLAW